MARKRARPAATKQRTLDLLQRACRACGSQLQVARHSHRTVTTLHGVYRLTRDRSTSAPIVSAHGSTKCVGLRKKEDGHCRMGNSGWM